MGMGVALCRADVSVDEVREAAQAILADPAYQQAASGARAGLDDMLSLDAAVDLLECLAASS
jgi:hypothetical protein